LQAMASLFTNIHKISLLMGMILSLEMLLTEAYGKLALPMSIPIMPKEKTVWIGANEFLYTDRLDAFNIPEIGFRYGITERWSGGIFLWRLGIGFTTYYRAIGNPNSWFRLGIHGDSGVCWETNNSTLSTTEVGIDFDVSLSKNALLFATTGWRWISPEQNPLWRLSGGVWLRRGSWAIVPEISLVRFAQFDPTLPPFYFNPGISLMMSW